MKGWKDNPLIVSCQEQIIYSQIKKITLLKALLKQLCFFAWFVCNIHLGLVETFSEPGQISKMEILDLKNWYLILTISFLFLQFIKQLRQIGCVCMFKLSGKPNFLTNSSFWQKLFFIFDSLNNWLNLVINWLLHFGIKLSSLCKNKSYLFSNNFYFVIHSFCFIL